MTVIPSTGLYTDGGVKPPELDPLMEIHVESEHQNVDELSRTTVGNVDMFSGKMELKSFETSGSYSGFADYRRQVLLVNDPVNPYLIDINFATAHTGKFQEYIMKYTGNSDIVTVLNLSADPAFKWVNLYNSEEALFPSREISDLFIQPFGVEYPLDYALFNDDYREAFIPNLDRGDGVKIKRMAMYGRKPDETSLQDYTTISLIKALPGGVTPAFARNEYGYTGNNIPNGAQCIIWPINTSTIDVVISWSSIIYAGYPKVDCGSCIKARTFIKHSFVRYSG